MQELVFMVDEELRTSSEIIAKGTLNEHASVIKLVRIYETYLLEFGGIEYKSEKQKRGGHNITIALLNERQTAFLLTLMRNNKIVINFKMNLIKTFYAMQASNVHLLPYKEVDKERVFSYNCVLEDDLPLGFGVVYAVEYGNYLKIGHSTKPKRRITSLKHQAEKYAGVPSLNYAVSINMTNYREIESYLHKYFIDARKDGTELFNMKLNTFLVGLPELEVKTDNKKLVEELTLASNNIHNFIGQERTLTWK